MRIILLIVSIVMILTSFVKSFKNNYSILNNNILRMSSKSTAINGSKYVLVPVGDGSEEIETTTIVDTLVRGGAVVVTASVGNSLQVTCSRGVKILADKFIQECINESWDLVVCPGGMPGATNLKNSDSLKEILIKQNKLNKPYAAICAAPAVVLNSYGLLKDKKATAYPKFQSELPIPISDQAVVVDGNVITSQGPATSLAFSLTLVELLFGKDKSQQIAKEMLYI